MTNIQIKDFIKTKQELCTEKLLTKSVLNKTIDFINTLYNKTDEHDKKLFERRVLLFLVVFLTGMNLKTLVQMRTFNLNDLFQLKNQISK